jgi:FkbM family methyltransferase
MAWGTREPAVLDWLDSFQAPFTFMDVGSNFGTESLYVALRHPQGSVIACDPELIGSYNLAVNIALNGIASIENYVVALGDSQGWIEVAENVNYLYPFGRAKYAAATKRVRVETIDALAARPVTYLKIDVDGLEGRILTGAERTLSDPTLRSLVVEVDEPADRPGIRERLAGYGFAVDPRYPGDTNNLFFRRG